MAFFNGCVKAYRGLILTGEGFKHLLLLAFRLYWGLSFFLSGWGKWHHLDLVINFFQSLGIPFPAANAYIASSIECIGGGFLLIGFASRLAAVPLAIVMSVALFTAHHDAFEMLLGNPENFVTQVPVTYLMVALIVFAVGPGMFSVDGILKKWWFQREKKK